MIIDKKTDRATARGPSGPKKLRSTVILVYFPLNIEKLTESVQI